MKRLFLIFALSVMGASTSYVLAESGMEGSKVENTLVLGPDCDSWAAGFLEAFETYFGCMSDGDYNATYSNLVAHCEGQQNQQSIQQQTTKQSIQQK